MEEATLTFTALEERIEALPTHSSQQFVPSKRALWGFGLIAFAGGMSLIVGKFLPAKPWVLFLLGALITTELAGFMLLGWAQIGGFNVNPTKERREYAETLDFDLPHHQALVTWLRGFPGERLRAMSAFASHRSQRMQSKLPLLTGSLDTLGALPVFAALVIQFKEMHWPPQLSWPQILLFGLLLFVYWLSLLQAGVRLRLELYDALLKKALEPAAAGANTVAAIA